MAGIAYDLVLLWYAARVQQGCASGWPARPWYRSKATPSFFDMLTVARTADPSNDALLCERLACYGMTAEVEL